MAGDGRASALHRGHGLWRGPAMTRALPDVVMACCGDMPTLRNARRRLIMRDICPT
jgi:phosphoketolase